MVYISARIHKYICIMNITKLNIIISFLLTALSASAMKYQIKVLNTPSITIDNKVSKVGDWFDDQSVIVWSKDNQAMRVVSEDNKVYTLSAKLYKESKSKKFSDFIIYTKPLAARGTNNLDLIEQLAERFDNTFVMLDEIVIDLSGVDVPVESHFIIKNNSYNSCNADNSFEAILDSGLLRITRNIINEIISGEKVTVVLGIQLNDNHDAIDITDVIIELLPLQIK